jgi:hypothetical protein
VSDLAGGLRTVLGWMLLAIVTALLVVGLQWKSPERSVEPIADRFLCDGSVAVGPTTGPGEDIVRDVICLRGRSADDITALTLVVLGVPCALVLATATLLFRRFLAPRQRVGLRRAPGAA